MEEEEQQQQQENNEPIQEIETKPNEEEKEDKEVLIESPMKEDITSQKEGDKDIMIISGETNENTINEEIHLNNNNINETNTQMETEGKLFLQTKKNKGMDLKEFFEQERHYFIMTDGGKPIYSRYGDEIKNSEILATFSAIMTKFTVFNTDESFAEKLNYISNEKSTTVFLKKGSIIFIALSKLHDSISFLYSQLELLYSQLLSIITSSRMGKLEDNPNCCMGTLIDTQELFEQMLILTSSTMASHIAAYQVLPFENRYKLNDICNAHRGNALICCILSPIEIIALSKTNLITLTYTDVILIQNFILHSESLQSTESWVPLCLPGISSEGYLQMYSNFTDRIGIVFITESQDYEYFLKFAEKSRVILDEMNNKQLLPKIEKNLKLKNDVNSNTFDKSQMGELYKKIFQLPDIDEVKNEESITISSSSITINNDLLSGTNSESVGNVTDNSKANKQVEIKTEVDQPILSNKEVSIEEKSQSNSNITTILSPSKTKTIETTNTKPFSENVYRVKDIKRDPLIKLKYAVCKHKVLNQYFSLNFGPIDLITTEELDIYRAYGKLYDLYNSQLTSLINTNNFFHFEKDNQFSHCIFASDNYILMASFNLFMPFDEIHAVGKEMLKVIKSYESNFFIYIK